MTLRLKIRDLQPLHSVDVSRDRPKLRRLSDGELLAACNAPIRNDRLKRNTRTGKLVDGNGRAYELKRRAADPTSGIDWDTEVDVEPNASDDSMFNE